MSCDERSAQRLASWWVEAYTRTAPADVAVDRRAEVESDVFEQAATGRVSGESDRQLFWSVAGRVLRGVPADLSWRLEVEGAPGRLEWHLRHPTTVLGLAFVVVLPLVVLGDIVQGRVRDVDPSAGWPDAGILGWAGWVLSCVVVGFVLVALSRVRPRRPRVEWFDPRRVRAGALCSMCFLWALSGVWRFSPGLDLVSDVAWVGFGLALVAYVLVVVTSLVGCGLTRIKGLDFRKIPS